MARSVNIRRKRAACFDVRLTKPRLQKTNRRNSLKMNLFAARSVNFVRRHAFIISLVIVGGVIRFAILFLSQRHVISDEAIVGLMAKHILEGRNFPFYLYGVSYSGSGAWEAYLAVIPFALFGLGVFALKSVTVLLSLVCLVLFYAMARKLYDQRVAAIA